MTTVWFLPETERQMAAVLVQRVAARSSGALQKYLYQLEDMLLLRPLFQDRVQEEAGMALTECGKQSVNLGSRLQLAFVPTESAEKHNERSCKDAKRLLFPTSMTAGDP